MLSIVPSSSGASPRERRNQPRRENQHSSEGRISARAEEPIAIAVASRSLSAHLRASGGTILRQSHADLLRGASPRERRNR